MLYSLSWQQCFRRKNYQDGMFHQQSQQ